MYSCKKLKIWKCLEKNGWKLKWTCEHGAISKILYGKLFKIDYWLVSIKKGDFSIIQFYKLK
jgi:hypothetical protein